MARIIPPQPHPDAQHSEQVVHQALTRLPAPWVVLYDIPMVVSDRSRSRMEQLDFLLIHPQRGLCVLEVKGGELELQEGTWYQTSRYGHRTELRRGPFDQATAQRKELQRFLYKHLAIRDDAMAQAVALPDVVFDREKLGPDAPRGIILDQRDLQDVEDAVQRAMRVWKTRATLTDADIERVISLLKPSVKLTVMLRDEVKATEKGLRRVTHEQVAATAIQARVFEDLVSLPRMVVIGEAGTGKTVLAIERAKRLTEAGMRTLLLCHRAAVAAFMRTLLGGGTRTRLNLKSPSDLTVAPFTELVKALADQSGRDYQATHSRDLPDWMLSAAEELGLWFDALVIDEAQEFTRDQLVALQLFLTDPDESPLYLFADPFQSSAAFSVERGRQSRKGRYNWTPPEGIPLWPPLVDNVRNSKPIADAVHHFLASQQSIATVNGAEPELVQCARSEVVQVGLSRAKKLINEERFRANQMLVVAVDIDKDAVIRAARKLSMDPMHISGVWRFPLPPTDLRVAIGSPDDVQGLEAEVVIVLYAGSQLTGVVVRDLYVAASRARSLLIVVSPRPLQQLYLAAQAALATSAE